MNSASVAVVLVFFICWTPFHSQRLMFVIVTLQGKWNHANSQTHHILFLASGLSVIPHFPCTHPTMYYVMGRKQTNTYLRTSLSMLCHQHKDVLQTIWSTTLSTPQCLKITQKVSFYNIATFTFYSQTVLPDSSRSKIGGKCHNSKIQKRHFV